MRSSRALVAGLPPLMLALVAGSGEAYPYFQTTSGTDTCVACHVSPTGGGALTEWGRGEAGDTLARGGDGLALHGLIELPAWIDLTGGVRLASVVNDVGNDNGAEAAVFPMQAELGLCLARGSWNAVASAGMIGAVRGAAPSVTGTTPDQPSLPWLSSREHYVMWSGGEQGTYVRAGKFALQYGLRLADHTAYVRRGLGLGVYQEPYAVSAGHLGASWDVHATAYLADRWRGDRAPGDGAAVMVERRHGSWTANANARVAIDGATRLALGGVTAKLWREPESLLWLLEFDVGRESLPGMTRARLATYAGLVWLPFRGLSVGAAHELFDVDLGRAGDTRHAADVWSSFLPRAHLELALAGRYQWIGSDQRAAMILAQVHYFL